MRRIYWLYDFSDASIEPVGRRNPTGDGPVQNLANGEKGSFHQDRGVKVKPIYQKHQSQADACGSQEVRNYKSGEVNALDLALPPTSAPMGLEAVHVVRSVCYNQCLASDIHRLALSTEGLVDWVHTQIYLRHTGPLQGPNGEVVDKCALDVTAEFSQDSGRYMSSYLLRREGLSARRLQKRLIGRVQFINLAYDIWTERLQAQQ